MRKTVFLIVFIVFMSFAVLCASAYDEAHIEAFKGKVKIGTWVGYTATDEGVRLMKENGIDFSFMIFDAQQAEYEYLNKYNIDCIGRLWLGDNATDAQIKQRLSAPFVSLPNFLGHLVKDEPRYDNIVMIGDSVDAYKRVNSVLIPYVNLFPDVPAAFSATSNHTYLEYLNHYVSEVDNSLLSVDIYPHANSGTSGEYYSNLYDCATVARENGREFWLFVQSEGFNSQKTPTFAELRFQMYSGLAFGATKLMHFNYGTPPSGVETFAPASVDINGNRTELWDITKKINDEIHCIAPIIDKYDNLGVTVAGDRCDRNKLTISLNEKGIYSGFDNTVTVDSTRSVLVGCFESNETDCTDKAIIVQNADLPESIENDGKNTVTLSFAEPKTVTYYPDGVKTELSPDSDGVFQFPLALGQGILVEFSDADITCGDINGDGSINIIDALFALRYAAGVKTLGYYEKCAMDVTGDRDATIADALNIFKYVAGVTADFR